MKKGFLLSTSTSSSSSSSSSGKKTLTRVRVDAVETKKKGKDDTSNPQWNKGFLLSPKSDKNNKFRKDVFSSSHDTIKNGPNISYNSQPSSSSSSSSSNQFSDHPQKENGKLRCKDVGDEKLFNPENDVMTSETNLVECSSLKNDKSSWQKGFLLSNTKIKKPISTTTTTTTHKEHCKKHEKEKISNGTAPNRKSLQKNSCSDLLSFEKDSTLTSNNNLFHIQLVDEIVEDEGNDQTSTKPSTGNSTNYPMLVKPNGLLLPLEEDTTAKNDDWMLSPIQTKRNVRSEHFPVQQNQQQNNINYKLVTDIDHILGQWTRSFERRQKRTERPRCSTNLSHIILNWTTSNVTFSNEQLWIETIFCHSTLLRSVATHAKDKFQIKPTEKWWFDLPPCLQLGVIVLNKYSQQACEVCNKLMYLTKDDKIRHIGVTVLWKTFFQFSTNHDMKLCQSFLLPQILPQLMKNIIACSDDKKPTMLHVSYMDAALSIYHYIANTWHHCCTRKEDVLEFSKTILWDGPWNQMIVMLGHWADLRKQKHPLRPSIVEDFKCINKTTPDPSNPQDIESCCFYFCQSILGNGSCLLGGGLICTMHLRINYVDTRDASPHEAYENLEKVQQILSSGKPGNMTQVCNLMRGFIAWIDKGKNNSQLKESNWCRNVIELCIYLLRYDQPRPIQLIMTIL